MQIKEVSTRTGLTIKTIRFYEERGLISPKIEWRNGKNYRDYQERDIEQLHMVAVLRKCLFSIDQIKTMLDHPELTQDVFLEYREALLTQRELLNLLADKAETVDVKTLKDPETLARRLTTTAGPLPLPRMDVSPNFGRFDPETPEERRAAFLQWQKHYKFRFLRWAVPLGVTVLVLLVMTIVQTNTIMSENAGFFEGMQYEMASAPMRYRDTGVHSRGGTVQYVLPKMTYGVYNSEGQLLPLGILGVTENAYRSFSAEQIVAFVINDTYFPWEIDTSESKRDAMAEYVNRYGTDIHYISTGFLRQTLAASVDITIREEPYTLVLFLQASPLLMAVRRLLLVYVLVAVLWGVVLAVKSTKGYGFKVQFLRSYDFFGNRWNNAILSVDENNDNATLLTQQYSGMSNLVSMDYKKDE